MPQKCTFTVYLEVFHAINGTFISMVFVFRAKSQNNEKSNTELKLFELVYSPDILKVQ